MMRADGSKRTGCLYKVADRAELNYKNSFTELYHELGGSAVTDQYFIVDSQCCAAHGLLVIFGMNLRN